MTRRTLTWLAAAGLFALYAAYSRSISPLARPPEIASGSSAGAPSERLPAPLTNLQMARRYLPHVPWAADAQYQLRTKNSFVYAEDWKPIDADNAIRFKPFAMVWMQKGRKEGEEPITIVSESAYIRFVHKFDITSPNPGRVIGGSLEGPVEIRGPNGLKVIGRNFAFSEKAMRLWSDAPVRFAYGPHRGAAHGLQCELLGPDGPKDPDRFAVSGIQSIRLRRDVVMNLLFQGSATEGHPAGKAPPQRPPSAAKKKPVLVHVRSKGSFEYGVQTNVATFEDDVRVFRPTNPGQFDVLLCDLLTLIFEPAKTRSRARQEADRHSGNGGGTASPEPRRTSQTLPRADASEKGPQEGPLEGLSSRLVFQRLRAQPRHPRRHVVLISESNHLTAHMDDLIYDAQSNVALLRDREAVHVVQDHSETEAPSITLLQDKGGAVTSLLCEGAGWIKHFNKTTGQVDLTARWRKRLRKFPDPLSPLDIIELQDDALLQQPVQQSSLKAGFIRIWMDRRKNAGKRTLRRGRAGLFESGPGSQTPALQPETRRTKIRRLLALEQVELTSPDLVAHTRRLEAWFEQHEEREPSERQPGVSAGGESRKKTGPPTSTRTAWASVPALRPGFEASRGAVSGEPSGTSKTPRRRKDGPLEVWAKLMRVRIGRLEKKETRVREIWTLGEVRVLQKHSLQEEPLRMTGDRLHVVAEGDNDHVLHIFGAPAHIRDRGMHIEGENIHLDRGENESWVDGKGLLQLPVKKSLDGQLLPQPQLLDIWWKKDMHFDGETARFRGLVRAVVEDSRIRCEEMDVEMSQRISFRERKRPNAQRPQVKTVLCRGGVQLESYRYEENRLIQIRKAHVERFSLQQATGETAAAGPGWIIVWRRANNQPGRPKRRARVRANHAAAAESYGWNYTRIDFSGPSTGNLKERYNRFRDHVQIVYGPVDRPPHVIDVDADQLPEESGWLRCRELILTQHQKTRMRPSFTTLRAEGNAEVDGRGFHARADTITYDESQDLYILRSLGRQKATIWRQPLPGAQRSRADAQRMQFIPSQNVLTLDRTTTLDGLR